MDTKLRTGALFRANDDYFRLCDDQVTWRWQRCKFKIAITRRERESEKVSRFAIIRLVRLISDGQVSGSECSSAQCAQSVLGASLAGVGVYG